VSGEVCDGCVTCFEKYVENKVRESFVSGSGQLSITNTNTNGCDFRGAGFGPKVTVKKEIGNPESPIIDFSCIEYATSEIISPMDGTQRSWKDQISFTAVLEDFFAPALEDFFGTDTYQRSITLTSDREEDGEICTAEGDSNELVCKGNLKTLGQHTVRLDASDEVGTGFKPDSISIEIVNEPPSVTLVNPENGLIRSSDQYVSFNALVLDPDDEIFFRPCPNNFGSGCVTWRSDGLDITPGAGSARNFIRILSPGVHEITCTARDGKGEESSASSTTVTVLDEVSGKPSAHIRSIMNLNTDQSIITMSGLGADSQDLPNSLRYEWFSDLDGKLPEEGMTIEVPLSNDAGMTQHIITLRVTDTDENWDEVSVPYTVKTVLQPIFN
jgi:hypothetical protein